MTQLNGNSALPDFAEDAPERPLEGILVLDFSQFLSGPSATLRLADLGARVIKIERPGIGDICRTLYVSNVEIDGDSSIFHAINRNKESYAADLKNPADLEKVRRLVSRADVLIQNFRPGVMERLGLDYESVKQFNPGIVYGVITGYGTEGPWRDHPGQDLLVQARSGLAWLNGDREQPPVPFGLSIADMMAGAHLAQGVLAALARRAITGEGAKVEVSLLESVLDLQFEVLTTFLNDGGELPVRAEKGNANAYLAAPYGIYPTADGYLALAMGSIVQLAELLECPELASYTDPKSWMEERDTIKRILARHLMTQPTAYWLNRLEPADYWCAEVLNWDRLLAHEGFSALDMLQTVCRTGGTPIRTTRCPIRIDGRAFRSPIGSPAIGEHTLQIDEEFQLNQGG